MIGSNFDTPIMYQDLANSTMGPLNMPFGMYGAGLYGAYSPYLGGIQLPRQLDQDKFQTMQKKENEGKKTMKIAGAALAIILALGGIGRIRKGIKTSGGLTKYLGNKWDGLINWIKGNKKPKIKKTNWFKRQWQKFKNWSNTSVV